MVDAILNIIVAAKFARFSDAVNAGANPHDLAQGTLNENWRVILIGNNYNPEVQKELTNRGIWRIESGVEVIAHLTTPTNIKFFREMKVLTKEESESCQQTLHDP